MTIRILLCDDQALITEGMQMILETDREIKVVGAARDGVQVTEMTAELKPDIVLMDLKMPGMNGVHATRAIRRDFPELPVLVLTTFDADDWVMDAIRAGASGYLLKDTPRDQLIQAIKDTVAGKAYIDPNIAGKLLGRLANAPSQTEQSTLSAQLNEREIELLTLMTHGLNYGEIAKRMFLSEGTVRNYASAMFTKMNVSDRMQAVTLAMRFGLTNGR
jgi:two-component system, NarL family, response regulator LiaR